MPNLIPPSISHYDTVKRNTVTDKTERYYQMIREIANKHGLQTADLKAFVENIMNRMIFDGEKLTDLMEPLELGWKQRSKAETALMKDLVPQLNKLAQGREISGLEAYE